MPPAAERLTDVTIMNYSQLLIPHMPSLVRQGVDNLTNMCDTIEYLNNIVIEVFLAKTSKGPHKVILWSFILHCLWKMITYDMSSQNI